MAIIARCRHWFSHAIAEREYWSQIDSQSLQTFLRCPRRLDQQTSRCDFLGCWIFGRCHVVTFKWFRFGVCVVGLCSLIEHLEAETLKPALIVCDSERPPSGVGRSVLGSDKQKG